MWSLTRKLFLSHISLQSKRSQMFRPLTIENLRNCSSNLSNRICIDLSAGASKKLRGKEIIRSSRMELHMFKRPRWFTLCVHVIQRTKSNQDLKHGVKLICRKRKKINCLRKICQTSFYSVCTYCCHDCYLNCILENIKYYKGRVAKVGLKRESVSSRSKRRRLGKFLETRYLCSLA